MNPICRILALTALWVSSVCAAQGTGQTPLKLDITPQSIDAALNEFARQSGMQVVLQTREVQGITSKRLVGTFTPEAALSRLLADTGLAFEYLDSRTVAVRLKPSAKPGEEVSILLDVGQPNAGSMRLAQTAKTHTAVQQPSAGAEAGDAEDAKGIPEILVKGSRGASTDIRRSNDDVQPYVVFDSEEIENSMAASLDDFLRERLPMNQSLTRIDENGLNGTGNTSRIDLRGLGAEETLVLVNGRRMPGVAALIGTSQPDLNGIPLSAIERIEVLPSTAGGIYGGGATGGVVNVVLKRDYSSMEVTARYDGTFAGGGSERRLDGTAGFSLGRTNVMIMGSIRDGQPLYVGDRDFSRDSRQLQYENNPDAFAVLPTPVYGYTTNIRNSIASPLVLRNGTSLNSRTAHVAVGSAGYAVDGAFAFQPGYNLDLADATFGNQYSLLTVPKARSIQVNLQHEFSDRISAFLDVSRLENKTVRMGTLNVDSNGIVSLPATVPGPNNTTVPNPANPFTTAVTIAVPLVGYDNSLLEVPSDSLTDTLNAGLRVHLAGDWIAQAEYSLGVSEFNATLPLQSMLAPAGFAALANGTLDPLRDVNLYPLNLSPYYPVSDAEAAPFTQSYPVETTGGTLRVSGPLMKFPGGRLQLSALLERYEQYTGDRVQSLWFGPQLFHIYSAEVGSTTDSAYAELTAPLISRANARPGIQALELMASYRYDGTTTRAVPYQSSQVLVPSPDGPFPDNIPFDEVSVTANQFTLGLRYKPVESVALRASFGKGVLPPSPTQLTVNLVTFGTPSQNLIDEKRGNNPLSVQYLDGMPIEVFTNTGRLNLRPENSESVSAGLIFTPTVLPGFRLSVDYTHIQKADEITTLSHQVLLNDEDLFPGAVARRPLTPEDEALGYTAGTIREFHAGPVNIAEMKVEAFDVQATYDWSTRFGSFAANLAGTIQPTRTERPTPESSERNPVGYRNGPMKIRVNAGLRWSLGNVDLGWHMRYLDAYYVYTDNASVTARANAILSQGSSVIPSQTYHDVSGRYSFGETNELGGGILKNTELRLAVQNVFNTAPHTLAGTVATGLGGLYARGGNPFLRQYSISIKKGF